MEVHTSFITDVGRKRKANEDSFLSNDWLGLYLVADGMGGHSCGDVASQTAVEVIKGKVEMAQKNGSLKKSPSEVLVEAIKLGNQAVWELSSKMPGCRSMGTTVSGLIFGDTSFFTANVGDSRIYRIRDNTITQLTTDHSLVEEQIAMGTLTREQARTSPVKNVITRALGLSENVEVDTAEFEFNSGDYILLCTDGLNGMVEDEEILKIIRNSGEESLNAAASKLIELANLNGGSDNVTAVLLRIDK